MRTYLTDIFTNHCAILIQNIITLKYIKLRSKRNHTSTQNNNIQKRSTKKIEHKF